MSKFEKYTELQHLPVNEGKDRAKKALSSPLNIQSYEPVLDGRWRALVKKQYHPDTDMEWLVKEILGIPSTLSDITSQRAVYYMLRGRYPDRMFRGNALGSDKFYGQLTGDGMKYVQLASGVTMQSLGIWAAPKGYIAGDGRIYTQRRGNIPLTAQPTLNFDLADVGAKLSSNARKVIHFEKDAGFSNIVAGDMPKYIEAIFSTAQGQLTEAANKFLREAENQGLQIYSVHDADPFGIQMSLLYGIASKNNCYMADVFYPKKTVSLGFFPSIAKLLNLPPEKIEIDSGDHSLFGYLTQVASERTDWASEVDTITKTMNKWEFQALNAIDEKAPQIYLVEGLRARDDEIKHVPDGDQLKERVLGGIRADIQSKVENAIRNATDRALDTVRQEIEDSIREALTNKIAEFNSRAEEMLAQVAKIPGYNFREAVKQELVNNPADYWDTGISRVGRQSYKLEFAVDATVEVIADVNEVTANIVATPSSPKKPKQELTKDDIVASIEKRIVRQIPEREHIVTPMREAFEQVFGKPDQRW